MFLQTGSLYFEHIRRHFSLFGYVLLYCTAYEASHVVYFLVRSSVQVPTQKV